jgi:hypothetical protein
MVSGKENFWNFTPSEIERSRILGILQKGMNEGILLC